MKLYKINSQKKNIRALLKKINSLKNTETASVVGSFAENKNIFDIGDLDIVVITKLINIKFINECKSIIRKHNFKIKKKLKINDTFGPVKYNKNIFFTVHLMIYDIFGHINHSIKSPFTCFDWERKNMYSGKKLSDIYSVNNLQLDDFFYSRRSIINHYNDLKREKISTYSYKFTKKNYSFIYKKVKLNPANRINYCKHIYQHTINNFYKFWFQKNVKLNKSSKKKFWKKIKFSEELCNKVEYLLNKKDPKVINSLKVFLDSFFLQLKKIRSTSVQIIFIRHAKTSLNNNTFLSKRNVGIINFNNKLKKSFDEIFSSPLKRSIQTAKKFKSKKITIDKLLKEINYGDAEGFDINQLKKTYPRIIKNWNLKKDSKFPNGENNSMVALRVKKFIKNLISKVKNNKSKKYLVVTHNVFLRSLIGGYFQIHKSEWHKLKIHHLEKFNFILLNGKLISNINRKTLKKVLNFKTNEPSSIN